MRSVCTVGHLTVLLLAFGGDALAQRPSVVVRGQVVDSLGSALSDVELVMRETDQTVRSDSAGRFMLRVNPGSYLLTARRPGFVPVTWPINVDDSLSVDIVLSRFVSTLPQVVINGERMRAPAKLAGFYERLRTSPASRSSFVTRADIERRNAARTSDIIRDRTGRSSSCLHGMVYLDGVLLQSQSIFAPPAGKRRTVPESRASMDFIAPQEIEAMEIYTSSATIPAQYNITAPSGTPPSCVMLIWTR